jgi:hypothetical protein
MRHQMHKGSTIPRWPWRFPNARFFLVTWQRIAVDLQVDQRGCRDRIMKTNIYPSSRDMHAKGLRTRMGGKMTGVSGRSLWPEVTLALKKVAPSTSIGNRPPDLGGTAEGIKVVHGPAMGFVGPFSPRDSASVLQFS